MTVYNSTIQSNVNNSSMVLAAQPSEMGRRNSISSIEIAEEAGRNHKDVMRSIREMESAWEKVNGRKFALVDYIDKKGESRPCYQFNYEEFMYVISKFDDITRAKLVTRWAKVETGQETPMYQRAKQPQPAISLKEHIEAFGAWVQMTDNVLKLDDYSKFLMIKTEGERLSLPIPPAPKSDGPVDSVTNLLKSNNVMNGKKPMSAVSFNKVLIERGYMRDIPRINSKGKEDSYKNLTDKGLQYGINRWNENSTSPVTQPYFYIDKFSDLLKELGLK